MALPPLPVPDVALFAADHAGARAHFRAALAAHPPAWAETVPHPLPGPAGEPLALELAWYGPRDAARVLVTQSALHGVEGFAGSAVQAAAVRWAPPLPPDTAILHLHAVNPWGFAWLRRCNEDGVDLNRNFVDFSAPLPENPGYVALAAALAAPPGDAAAQAQLEAFRAAHGQGAFERAVTGGQYSHPQGLFHGGHAPAWTRLCIEALAARLALARRELVVVVDLHTGLGPYGYGEVICDHPPGSRGVRLARRLFGASVTEPNLGTSTSVPKAGLVDYFWHALLPGRCCFVTLEFGTWPLERMLPVLQADHALHAAGPVHWADPAVQQVKAALRHHFYPAARDWQELVLFRGLQVLRDALAGMPAAGEVA